MSGWMGIPCGFSEHRWQNGFKRTELSSDDILTTSTRNKNWSVRPHVQILHIPRIMVVERTVEEKAAMLLYLVTKNHLFSDDNKRIAATLFLWFMADNGILYNPDGSKHINDNALVVLTLMIAENRTKRKNIMVKVVVNLANKNNYEQDEV